MPRKLFAAVAVAALGVTSLVAGAAPAAKIVTYSKDVAPILNHNCVGCHRQGESAPMSLLSYKEVRPWAKSIREKVVNREMPPWHADPAHGKFLNSRTLPQQDVEKIVAWVDGGMKEGDAADLPAAPKLVDGWNIPKPDAVFRLPEAQAVPASGTVAYRNITVPTNFTEDRWITAAEIRPGNRALVHHVIVFVEDPADTPRLPAGMEMKFQAATAQPTQQAQQQRRQGGGQRGWLLVGTATGTNGYVFPKSGGKLVRAGSKLHFQMHYTPNGTAGTDQTSVGLVFGKQTPEYVLRTVGVSNPRFQIPAEEADYKVTSAAEFTEDALLFSLYPHMHLRGKAFEYRLVYPDARSEVILSVPKYDFNWQYEYEFASPIQVPKGARLECTAYFDNSKGNRYNPDSSKPVRWGDQTWEEMMIGWMTYSVAGQKMTGPSSSGGAR